MHISRQPDQFRSILLEKLRFQAKRQENYTLYQRPDCPDSGYYRFYQRKGFYDFGIAEYSIEKEFAVDFDHQEPVLRLGIVYDGVTRFRLSGQPVSSFHPSAFLVWEKGIRGRQIWEKGQHFHGAELTVYQPFLDELSERFPLFHAVGCFKQNHAYHYLPADILSTFHRMIYLDQEDSLNGMQLEAAVLSCMGCILEKQKEGGADAFSRREDYVCAIIGKDRRLKFTAQDLKTIQTAHEILTEQFVHPPTIEALSRELLMNQQKLKAGFVNSYHMTIGEYTASLKMSHAAQLLSTTDKSVEEIAKEVGYGYSSSFIKRFRSAYSCTPFQYRERASAEKLYKKEV